MPEENLGQCTFPHIDVCLRKDCPYKKPAASSEGASSEKAPIPYGPLLASGLAAGVLAPSMLPQPPAPPVAPSPIVSKPTAVTSRSNSLTEYLDICLTEGWKTLLPFSEPQDIFFYIFPELDYSDYEIPRYVQEENPFVFMYYFIEASKGCDISFFLELSDPNSGRINAFNEAFEETGGLIAIQPDYNAQVASRLANFGYAELPSARPSTQKYIFPRFLKEFSSTIEEESGEVVFLKGDDIAVMQTPSDESVIISYVDHSTVLRFNDAAFATFTQAQKAAMKLSSGWVPVILLTGEVGYVSSEFAYPSNDVRLILRETNGDWSYELIDDLRPQNVIN